MKKPKIAQFNFASKQALKIMKLAILFTVLCTLQSFAHINGQSVTLNSNNTEIVKVLNSIENQGSYRFLYNSKLKDLRNRVSVEFSNLPIDKVLDALFQSTTLNYKVINNNLIAIRSTNPSEQDFRVTGRILSDAGEPVSGASISVKGTTRGTTTDNAGNFSLNVPEGSTLTITAVGYESQSVVVRKDEVMSIKLVQAVKKIDEVVVIGYGTASKRDLTGSIAKVAGREVADRPNVNPVASLQGKVSGLYVVNSGTPGKEPDIRIRGTNSLSGDVKPLYLVDGIFQDNINYLNPADIESIEVLKDPSSLAIFGVRGANGVIAVTTKKAKAGQTVINFNSTFGTKKLVDKISMVNASDFLTMYNEMQDNIGVPVAERKDLSKWTGNTDWVDEMTRTGLYNATNVSITTATDKNKFYLSFGRMYDEGIIKHQQLTKYIFNMSDEVKLHNNIKVGFNFSGLSQRNPYGDANGLLLTARRVLPISPVYNSSKNAYYDLAVQNSQMTNPVMELEHNWDKQLSYENRFVSSVFAEVRFLKNFTFRSTIYGDMSYVSGRTYRPLDSVYNPETGLVTTHRGYNLTSVSQQEDRYRKWQQDHILNYKKVLGDHSLSFMTGFTTYETIYRGIGGSVRQSSTGKPIPNDRRFWYLNNVWGDVTTQTISAIEQWEKATVSLLLRGMYNYKGKYLATLSFRRDNASVWRPEYGNQPDNFYSVGLGWDVTKEDFFGKQNIFNYFKLKASYGKLGVQNTYGYNYPAYPALSPSYATFGDISVPVYTQNYLADPNLKWESVYSKEFGFEFATLNQKLTGELLYYRKDTKGLLAIVSAGGSNSMLTNLGDMRNKGIEASLTYNQKLANNINLSVGGNITTFDNQFLNSTFGTTVDEQYPNVTRPGFPVGYFYGLKVAGVIQSYAEKLAYFNQSTLDSYGPGDFKYEDVSGDGVITTDDRTMIGNPTPDFAYGGNVTLRYKNFDLGIDVQGVYGNEIYRYWGSTENPYTTYNFPSFRKDRWTGAGTSNWEPILAESHKINRYPSTYGIEDGSYFRLRNIQLGCNLSGAALKKAKITNMRVFVAGQNVKTWKNNSGYTPEFGGSAIRFGIDDGNNPMPAIFTAGVNVNF